MKRETMNAEEFRCLCESLWGQRWRRAAEKEFGKSRTTIWGYATGAYRLPVAVARYLQLLAEERDAKV